MFSHKNKKGKTWLIKFYLQRLLTHQDSNLDKQYQKLSYYHYTMGHPVLVSAKLKLFI